MDNSRGKRKAHAGRILNRQAVKEFFQEFLPGDRCLEVKLEEICSRCPLSKDSQGQREFSPQELAGLDECRMDYFGVLLQSFLGRPGDEETEQLYRYLKLCEGCLLNMANIKRSRPKKTEQQAGCFLKEDNRPFKYNNYG